MIIIFRCGFPLISKLSLTFSIFQSHFESPQLNNRSKTTLCKLLKYVYWLQCPYLSHIFSQVFRTLPLPEERFQLLKEKILLPISCLAIIDTGNRKETLPYAQEVVLVKLLSTTNLCPSCPLYNQTR